MCIRVYAYSNTRIRVLSYAYARIDCVCEVRLFLSGTVLLSTQLETSSITLYRYVNYHWRKPYCLFFLNTVPLRYTLTAHTRIIRTYAYEYTHIRVWVYAHTRMSIRTYGVYLYAHTRIGIRAYTHIRARMMCLCYSGRKSFLCVSLLWKRKSQSDDPTTKIEIFA